MTDPDDLPNSVMCESEEEAATLSTARHTPTDSRTLETLKEAAALIKALAPSEAPTDVTTIHCQTGLKIIKNDHMPEDTIVVSKRLFDLLFSISELKPKR